jgi:hypothetical protein
LSPLFIMPKRSNPSAVQPAGEIDLYNLPNVTNSIETTRKYDVYRRKIREVLGLEVDGSTTLPADLLTDENLAKCFVSIRNSYNHQPSALKCLQATIRSDVNFHGLPMIYINRNDANYHDYKFVRRSIDNWKREIKRKHHFTFFSYSSLLKFTNFYYVH